MFIYEKYVDGPAGKNAFLIDAFKQKKYCMSMLGASDLKDKSDDDIKRLMQ
ncbi:hypothetical protein [uncultured Methanobrevibacter sp.]|uniref:hypothetical protein n=1 Tax=uncultured Methanobrevibacter sp. TaxID=253161 RepID=UPI0025FE98ED|nr:hypothetical protein [uncultured Methanobrevibacter sp.]